MQTGTGAGLPEEVIEAIRSGQTIEAVKRLREREGLSLTEAKSRVDQYVANDPILSRQTEAKQSAANRSCLLFMAAVIAVAVLAYLYFSR